MDFHLISQSEAEVKVDKIKLVNKNKSISSIKNKVLKTIRKIESASEN